MADDLERLGIDWVEEGAVRDRIAVTVTAQASDAALDDQNAIKKAYKDLEKAELQLEELEESETKTAAHRSRLIQANTLVKTLAVKVNQLEVQVELRHQERIRRAREEQKRSQQQERLKQIRQAPVVHRSLEAASLASCSSVVVPSPSFSSSGVSMLFGAPRRLTVSQRGKFLSSRDREGVDAEKRRLASNHASASSSAVEEYRGAVIDTPANQVVVTAQDFYERHLRLKATGTMGAYVDDGDEESYSYRLQKFKDATARRATEKAKQGINSHQHKIKRKDEGKEMKEPSESSSPPVNHEEVQFRMKKEPGTEDDGEIEEMYSSINTDSSVQILQNEIVPQLKSKSNIADDRGLILDPSLSSPTENDDYLDTFIELLPGSSYVLSKHYYDRLLNYQKYGLQWLLHHHNNKDGCILGDEMGLGKTVQIAVLLNCLYESCELKGPVLIVAPLTVFSQWVVELHKWCPLMRTCIFHRSGSAETGNNGGGLEKLLGESKGNPYIHITSYTTMAQKIEQFHQVRYQYVILDEGHKISNPETAVSIAAKTFLTPHRIILTGTPIQNTLKELWCLFDFCKAGLLGTLNRFIEGFQTPISYSRNPHATKLEQATSIECTKLLREQIEPFLLRRLKKDVNAMLPPKKERVVRTELTDTQLELYYRFLMSRDVRNILEQSYFHSLNDGGNGRLRRGAGGVKGLRFSERAHAYSILMQLRMLCNHADIFRLRLENAAEMGGNATVKSFRSSNPVDYSGSSKLKALRCLLVSWRANGHKALVFSQFRSMLDIIENCVDQEGYTYIRLDGTTPVKSRSLLIEKFNTNPDIFIALMTTRVGGLGLNLTGADRVVIFDPDWNPVVDEQARERSWRIGQTRDVSVYRMIVSGTIEEHILHRQLAKTYVTEKVLIDPTLQRFFIPLSVLDSFYLGARYKNRVPARHRNLVCSTNFDLLEEDDDLEFERKNKKDNEATVTAIKMGESNDEPNSALQRRTRGRENGDAGGGGGGGKRTRSDGREVALSLTTPAVVHALSEGKHETSFISDVLDQREGGGTPDIYRRLAVDPLQRHLASSAAEAVMQRVKVENKKSIN